MRDPLGEVRRGPIARVFGTPESNAVMRIGRLDLVTVVLIAHGTVLVVADQVQNRPWVIALVVALGLWRIALQVAINRAPSRVLGSLVFAKKAGSLLITSGVIAADGGTESPFFFWTLLLLASHALVASSFGLLAQSAVAVVGYLGIILGVPDLTPTSLGRLGLLASFCAVLQLARVRIDYHRREAERADEILQDAFSLAPLGICVVKGPDREIVFANQRARDLAVISAMEDGGELRDTIESLASDAAESMGPVGPKVVKVSDPSGTRYVQLHTTRIGITGQEAVFICAADVTVEKRVAEDRKRFMMLASHQLRTPLTPIIAYADLLGKGDLTQEEISAASQEILQAGLEMQRLFERMANVALLPDADPGYGPTVPVGVVLDEIRRYHRQVLDGVEVEGDPRVTVRCRPEWVALAVGELLENGHRFGKPPIRLSWEYTDDHVEFSTSDSGSGPDESLTDDRLFGQWGAGAYDDMMPPGMRSHLGLFQARLLAGLSGGDLYLRRDNGSWAFVLTVPAGPSPAAS